MIKVVYCVTKKAELTDEEFFRYWEDIHGPIGARIPGLRKLVQSHRLIVPGDGERHDYDGVQERMVLETVRRALSSNIQWRRLTAQPGTFALDCQRVAEKCSSSIAPMASIVLVIRAG